ncbi:MAG: ATPase [marine bacterium B5-7]|nr:MAG: ATPase [marine bacterium B5-7]
MTLSSEKIQQNQELIGREREIATLRQIGQSQEAQIVIMYGRRRVGKTELLEQVYRERHVLKFEGIENKPEAEQYQFVLRQLGRYTSKPILSPVTPTCWLDVFDVIHEHTQQGLWTIYFEELQWLADYKDNFISELKVAWDNYFRRNPQLLLILCGSSPSFMIQHVVHSKALYNRSQHEMHLQPFSIQETKQFLGRRSNREIMNAYLTLGGIPEYLKRIKSASSLFTGICKQSFTLDGYFSREYKRIFISSMAESAHYQKIISFLSQHRFATREQIATHLALQTGGHLSKFLEELVYCGFIKKYSPYNLTEDSKLARYQINDNYLQFFFKFIQPELSDIETGRYNKQPTAALKLDDYHQWLGYAFERYCRDNHHTIANLLGFSGVKYQAGTFYNRATSKEDRGYQLDLIFDRADHVITVCEIKYLQQKADKRVIAPFDKSLSLMPNKKGKTVHRVLISAEGAEESLVHAHYFDNIITLDDLMVE